MYYTACYHRKVFLLSSWLAFPCNLEPIQSREELKIDVIVTNTTYILLVQYWIHSVVVFYVFLAIAQGAEIMRCPFVHERVCMYVSRWEKPDTSAII